LSAQILFGQLTRPSRGPNPFGIGFYVSPRTLDLYKVICETKSRRRACAQWKTLLTMVGLFIMK
jgi:hypothetical protein